MRAIAVVAGTLITTVANADTATLLRCDGHIRTVAAPTGPNLIPLKDILVEIDIPRNVVLISDGNSTKDNRHSYSIKSLNSVEMIAIGEVIDENKKPIGTQTFIINRETGSAELDIKIDPPLKGLMKCRLSPRLF